MTQTQTGAEAPTRSDGSDVLHIDRLQVTFATDAGAFRAVDDVSLDVHPGEIVAIVGESGSGKSVTARSILGLLPDTAVASGVVLLGGTDMVAATKAERRRARGHDVSMVFQEPSTSLNPVYPVGWQIAEGLRAHERLSRRAARARAIEVLRQVGIPEPEERVDYYPHQFSGGQKQRVVIAMALALRAGLIVADEPTTALDVTVQAEILELLRDLRDRLGTSIVVITHNMGVVADLADRVVVMYQGELVETAPAQQLFDRPAADYTRRLLDAVPRIGRNPARPLPGGPGEVLVAARGMEIEYPGRLGKPGFRAVRGIDFEIRAGEVLGLVGESGSGKTTTGRAIAGLTRITGGSLAVLGHEMLGYRERGFKDVRRRIGFVFQDPAASFDPHMTIAECVAEPLVVHHAVDGGAALRRRVAELLESVQLPRAYGDRYPHELSGGQRQRASLARALALEPELLIADEPTSALDVSVQAKVLELFRGLQQELGFAALFISHDLAVVDMLAHRIAVLYRGEIVETGPSARVLAHPTHPYTQQLLASLPVPDPAEQAARRERHRELLAQDGAA